MTTFTLISMLIAIGCAALLTRALMTLTERELTTLTDQELLEINHKKDLLHHSLLVSRAGLKEKLIKEAALLWGIEDNNHSTDIVKLLESIERMKAQLGEGVVDRIVRRTTWKKEENRKHRLSASHLVSHLVNALKLVLVPNYNVFTKHKTGGGLNDEAADN